MGKASDMNKVPDGAREVWEVLTVGQVTWRIIEKHATIVAAVLVSSVSLCTTKACYYRQRVEQVDVFNPYFLSIGQVDRELKVVRIFLHSQFAEEDRLNNGVTFALKASNKVLYLFILWSKAIRYLAIPIVLRYLNINLPSAKEVWESMQGDRLEKVFVSERVVESPKKTVEINPEKSIIEELRKRADADKN
ncbi:hypothetical protein C5167_007430 [Papaver somniferum]|nr:hypothetical protein C5167_007430 [Papaver somniferum]